MDGDRVFMDAGARPTELSLAEALGGVRVLYDRVLALADGFAATWAFTPTSGWMLKVADKKKALFYITPLEGMFNVGLTLREDERATLVERRALESLRPAIETARKFSEGYALYFAVAGPDECAQLELLVPASVELRR